MPSVKKTRRAPTERNIITKIKADKTTAVLGFTHLRGRTLLRYNIKTQTPERVEFYVRTPSDWQRKRGCDHCPVQHRPTDSDCSANWDGVSWANEASVLYDIQTRQPAFRNWRCITVGRVKMGPMHEEVWIPNEY